MGNLTREDVQQLVESNPTVAAWLTRYYGGKVTYTEALHGMVLDLVEQNKGLSQELARQARIPGVMIWSSTKDSAG